LTRRISLFLVCLNCNGVLRYVRSFPTRRSSDLMALSESRLKIPVLFGYDVVHGYRTIFPMPLAESCSWDLERMRKSAAIAADEADRKSTRLNSSQVSFSYAVFCVKNK